MMGRPWITVAAAVVLVAGSLSAQEDERLERIKAEIERLEDEAALAEREGRRDALEKVHARINELEAALRQKGDHPPEARELEAHLEALEAKARNAKEGGRLDELEEIRRQAKKVAARLREIREHPGHGPGPAGQDREAMKVEKRLGQIERELADAREHGEEDRAEQLRQEGRKLKAHLEKLHRAREGGPGDDSSAGGIEGPHDPTPEVLIDRIAKVRKEAVRAKQRGALREAKELWHEGNMLEGKLHAWMDGAPRPVKQPPAPVEKRGVKPGSPREHPELREEIERLRAEVGELRGLMKRVLEDGKRTSRTDF